MMIDYTKRKKSRQFSPTSDARPFDLTKGVTDMMTVDFANFDLSEIFGKPDLTEVELTDCLTDGALE